MNRPGITLARVTTFPDGRAGWSRKFGDSHHRRPNAINQMFFIPAYPFWSLMIIAVDVVALWGLCAYASRENATV